MPLLRAYRCLPLAAALSLAACQSVAPASTQSPQAALQEWVVAFNTCNAKGAGALYDPTAVLWGTVSPTLITSPDGIVEYFARACSSTPPPSVAVTSETVRLSGDHAVVAGTYTFTLYRDGRPRSVPARFSLTYRNVTGRWLIIDHHSSPAPAPAAPAGRS